MPKLRRYIKKAIYDILLEEQPVWFFARELEEKLSKKIGRNISAYSIANYLGFFLRNDVVIREKMRGGYRYKLNRRLRPEEVYF